MKMKNNNRINIYDLAELAGVSTTTVYKVIRGKKGVGDETRKLILELISKHNYRANAAARALAGGRIKIGVIIENYCSQFCEMVYSGIKASIEDFKDYNIEVKFLSPPLSKEGCEITEAFSEMREHEVNGIIVFPYIPYKSYTSLIDKFANINIPVAVVSINIPNCNPLFTITHNYNMVGRLGAELLSLYNPAGNNVLFIGRDDVSGHNILRNSFEETLLRCGGTLTEVYETSDNDTKGYELTCQLLTDHPEVKGIFVGTSQSLGICTAVNEQRRSDRISIICVDTFPAIISNIKKGTVKATIHQNPFLQGKTVLKHLADYLISNKSIEKNILINPTVVLRSNCEHFSEYTISS